jgi:hypothetical protein
VAYGFQPALIGVIGSIRVWCYLRVRPGYEVVAQNTEDPDIRISTSRSNLFHLLVDASPPGLAILSEGSKLRERLNEQSHRRHGNVAGRVRRRAERCSSERFGRWGHRIHRWVYDVESWRERQDLVGGQINRGDEVFKEANACIGAFVIGRRMFDEGEVGWPDPPPFRAPVFVLTHHARGPWALGREPRNFADYARETAATGVWDGKR